jgi:ABC-type polysaccharide/polyol phosphate export permease
MNQAKRFLGLLWMLLGPASFIMLVISAVSNINSSGKGDISNPIPWVIIIIIFAPIAVGLVVFGWYCWKGEYKELEHD